MAIKDSSKLEYLWKIHHRVSPTSSNKDVHNEHITRYEPIFQHQIWTDSNLIPSPPPNVTLAVGNEIWYSIIQPYKSENAVQLLPDPTSGGKAWVAVKNPSLPITDDNVIKNWVPPLFHPQYAITVWSGNPNFSADPTVRRVSQFEASREFEFDYVSGVLHFFDKVPENAKVNGIWIEGWVYVGGFGGGEGQTVPTSNIRTITYTTPSIPSGGRHDFELDTGGIFTLAEAILSVPGILECHSRSTRTDSNPYRFRAVDGYLIDDGSYTVDGQRFYGEKFITLMNSEDPDSTKTYWRVFNDTPDTKQYSIVVRVAY